VACNRGIHHEFDGFCLPHVAVESAMPIESAPMPHLHFCEQDVTWSFYSVALICITSYLYLILIMYL